MARLRDDLQECRKDLGLASDSRVAAEDKLTEATAAFEAELQSARRECAEDVRVAEAAAADDKVGGVISLLELSLNQSF